MPASQSEAVNFTHVRSKEPRNRGVVNVCSAVSYIKVRVVRSVLVELNLLSVDKKNQLDGTFCILYFSSNSCSTCFGQPCAHHQELTTA